MSRESHSARRAARRLLRWYPKPWRARYGVEMRELVDEMPVRWRQVADLAIGAGREWMSPRAFGWPARSAAGRIQHARILKFLFWACAIEAAAHSMRSVFPPDVRAWQPTFEQISITISMAATFRLLFAGLQVVATKRPWPLTRSEIGIWFVAILIRLIVDHVQPIPSDLRNPGVHVFAYHLQLFIWVNLLWMGSSRTRRLTKVYYSHRKREPGSRSIWFK